MGGDNRFVDDLRILASIKLYLNLDFYVKHPSFVKVMNSHSGVFNNVDNLLVLSVSHGALDSGKTKMELVKDEALNICSLLVRFFVCACFIFSLFVFYSLLIQKL